MAQLLLQRKKNIYVVVFLLKQRFQLLYGGAKEFACHNLEARITLPPNGNKDFPRLILPEIFPVRGPHGPQAAGASALDNTSNRVQPSPHAPA